MRVYKEQDLKSNLMRGARTAVLGYGNQGHAHALNLKESGVDVVVGARRAGSGWRRAEEDGFEPSEIGDAVESSDYVAMLLPDEIQGDIFDAEIRPRLKPGATLVFAHGFTIAFGALQPGEGHDVVLVAPKGQGHFLRKLYRRNLGLPCLVAIDADPSGSALDKALSYADALGCLRTGAIETTFREEAITDLFGEQTVLCGGVPALVKAAFETLVDRGYRPEIAYIECLHELKIIADLMYGGGIAAMRERISRTAAWGSYLTGNEIVSGAVKSKMKNVLDSIESGEFARGWRQETADGQKRLMKHFEDETQHPIEHAGEVVRALMPYLKEEDQ